jgi:hypothetical protein
MRKLGAWGAALILLSMIWATGAMAAPKGSLLVDTDEPAANVQVVTVGLYPITVYGLDIASSTYYLDTYVWFRWKGDIDPTQTMELMNAVDDSGTVKEVLLPEPTVLADGSKYQVLRVEGRFFQPFSLRDFPLDRQVLSVLIEDTIHPRDQIAYQFDDQESGYGDLLQVPGWNISGWSAERLKHDYGSSFGEVGRGGDSAYSAVRFQLEIVRPVSLFVWKLLLPLIIVLAANWVVLLLDPRMVDLRTAMPATSLLTTVFLQQSYSASLPEVGYLVLLDKIYAVAYLLIVMTLVRVIMTANTAETVSEDGRLLMMRNDRINLAAGVAAFAATVLWLAGT